MILCLASIQVPMAFLMVTVKLKELEHGIHPNRKASLFRWRRECLREKRRHADSHKHPSGVCISHRRITVYSGTVFCHFNDASWSF